MSQPTQSQPEDLRISVELEVPVESALDRTEAQRVARESFYIELYRRGDIGSGRAATLLGIERVAFLDLLSARGVSWWDDTMDITQELRNALP